MLSLFRRSFLLILILLTVSACHREDKTLVKTDAEKSADIQGLGDWSSPVAATETFYRAIDQEKFNVAWKSLSHASQEKFIAGVVAEEKISSENARELFEKNDMPLRLGFWKSFRESSKIPTIMAQASFKLLSEKEDRAEVQLTSGATVIDSIAIKENGEWKMGFVETFVK